ncbi:tripeptidyl-peptidase-like protein [Lasiosphaeria hispida]|uniref:tripeptidyl-peptidase II n=1 Tax=Lasiosphaeria hispida TaxID=260671 RepID=A0AAJ0HHQ0_9PEZI|nr:tripeptidyl-peptidase-like protein [Lasiosphaeria hispida]
MWPGLFLALLGLSIAPANGAPTVVLEKSEGIPPGWTLQSSASASEMITLFVALKEPGMHELKKRLSQRYEDPAHPEFGSKHLSRDEVHHYRKPNRNVIETVSGWLKSSGIRDVRGQGSVLSFSASVRTVKSLFQADLAHYVYGNDGKPVLRAQNYTVPTWLRDDIDFVHPITNFMPPRRSHAQRNKQYKPKPATEEKLEDRPKAQGNKPKTKACKARPDSNSTTTAIPNTISTPAPASASIPEPTAAADSTITADLPTLTLVPDPPYTGPGDGGNDNPPGTVEPDYPCLTGTYPDCIRQLYNITYTPATSGRSPARLGVAGFLEQWIQYSDVSAFMEQLAPELVGLTPPHNFSVDLIHGGINPQNSPYLAGMEASLDVEYAMALGYPTEVVYYVTGGRGQKLGANRTALPEGESDNEPYLEFLLAMLAKPDEELPHVLSISYADDEIGVPAPYAKRVCDLFAALTARGTTVVAATGDGGAAGTGETKCTANDGSGRKMFMPTFPASCPYVTSVGAVFNIAPPLTGADFSSGGFSTVFPRPAWQEEVVGPYVDKMVKAKDSRLMLLANRTGRAMPDISAIGSGFEIMMAGEMGAVLGTSASTPVVASMIALVNDARLRAGKPSIGWLNPLLYSPKVRAVLRDVITGRSSGCWFPDGSISGGWTVVEGYDCVTGLGTVGDFHDFLAVLS